MVRMNLLLLSLLLVQGAAFAPQQQPQRASLLRTPQHQQQASPTALSAIRRRSALTWFRRAFLAGAGLSTVQDFAFSANAEEAAPGKIVTFQVENLDGVEGNKGVVKLQLQPSWAPQGVERFEVSALCGVGWLEQRTLWDNGSGLSSTMKGLVRSHMFFVTFLSAEIDCDWLLE
jgi:hypothetical protein